MEQIAVYEHELTTYATTYLKEIPDIHIFSEVKGKGSHHDHTEGTVKL